MPQPLNLYLDMDEVLSDFVGGCANLFGVTRSRLDQEMLLDPGTWDVAKYLGRALGGSVSNGVPVAQFWQVIKQCPEFWIELQPLPWMDDLLALLNRLEEKELINWKVVSSPSQEPSCWAQKVEWLGRYAKIPPSRVILTNDKSVLATPNAILIDDAPHNLHAFKQACPQAHAIQFPTLMNSDHALFDRGLQMVLDRLYAVLSGAEPHYTLSA